MRLAGRLGVEAAGGKRFELGFVELVPVAEVPCAGDYRRYAVIAMGVGCDLGVCGDAQHNRVNACLIRITLEYHGLNSSHARTAGAGIALLRELVFSWSEPLFTELRVEEVANQCDRVLGFLFHQPMAGAGGDRLS